MTPRLCLDLAIRPACMLLGPRFTDVRADVVLLAIAVQESDLVHRRQVSGPARGWWQFELAGARGVLTHRASDERARALLLTLGYAPTATAQVVQPLLEHNDLLAAGFARLLLFTVPTALPDVGDEDRAWTQYVSAWRPGAVTGGGVRASEARARWRQSYATARGAIG